MRNLGTRHRVKWRGKRMTYHTNFYGKRVWPGLVQVDELGIRDMPTKQMLSLMRMLTPQKMAEDLLAVQPMAPDLFKRLYDEGMDETELVAQGYEPVSDLKLMWRNKNGQGNEEGSAEEGG